MLLPPRVSRDQAEEIAATHYGVAAVADRLAAEHDDTFRLVTADGTTRLLKIAQIIPGTRADAGASPTLPSFQTAVLLHLARAAPTLPVQRVIGTLDGRPELRLDGRVVRMTSYLEGPVLGSRPASAALRRDIGGTLARLDQALRPFAHPGANRTHLWDLQNFNQLRPLLDQLPGQLADRDQRVALVSCLDRFEARVLPRLADPATRRQVIHTDFPRRQPAGSGGPGNRRAGLRRQPGRAGCDGRGRRRLLPVRRRRRHRPADPGARRGRRLPRGRPARTRRPGADRRVHAAAARGADHREPVERRPRARQPRLPAAQDPAGDGALRGAARDRPPRGGRTG